MNIALNDSIETPFEQTMVREIEYVTRASVHFRLLLQSSIEALIEPAGEETLRTLLADLHEFASKLKEKKSPAKEKNMRYFGFYSESNEALSKKIIAYTKALNCTKSEFILAIMHRIYKDEAWFERLMRYNLSRYSIDSNKIIVIKFYAEREQDMAVYDCLNKYRAKASKDDSDNRVWTRRNYMMAVLDLICSDGTLSQEFKTRIANNHRYEPTKAPAQRKHVNLISIHEEDPNWMETLTPYVMPFGLGAIPDTFKALAEMIYYTQGIRDILLPYVSLTRDAEARHEFLKEMIASEDAAQKQALAQRYGTTVQSGYQMMSKYQNEVVAIKRESE